MTAMFRSVFKSTCKIKKQTKKRAVCNCKYHGRKTAEQSGKNTEHDVSNTKTVRSDKTCNIINDKRNSSGNKRSIQHLEIKRSATQRGIQIESCHRCDSAPRAYSGNTESTHICN